MTPTADVAVIGGSGFCDFVAGATEVALDTPYGPPCAVGSLRPEVGPGSLVVPGQLTLP